LFFSYYQLVKKKDRGVQWHDFLLAFLTFSACFYFFLHAEDISFIGWKCIPLGVVLYLVVLEGARRTGGPIYLAVVVILGLCPLYAEYLPGVLWGRSFNPDMLIEFSIFTMEGLLGLATKVVFQIILGFLVFAGVLIASGAGKFFLGWLRGMPLVS